MRLSFKSYIAVLVVCAALFFIFHSSIRTHLRPTVNLVADSKSDSTVTNGYTKAVWKNALVASCSSSVAIMTIVNDKSSWGEGGRTFSDYAQMLSEMDYPLHCLSLHVLVSSKSEFSDMRLFIEGGGLQKYSTVSLIHRDAPEVSSRGERKGDNIQRLRRRLLAIVRNQLLYATLDLAHTHVLWVDSDIIKVPSKTLEKMVNSGKDILAAQCTKGGGEYDMNSWAGPRLAPNSEEWDTIDAGGLFVPRPTEETRFMNQWQGKSEFMSLDSVGGTFLLVKADIHRSGIAFSPIYLIGAGWERAEGYDGIETEGLCYVAKAAGFSCWGMPREFVIHSEK